MTVTWWFLSRPLTPMDLLIGLISRSLRTSLAKWFSSLTRKPTSFARWSTLDCTIPKSSHKSHINLRKNLNLSFSKSLLRWEWWSKLSVRKTSWILMSKTNSKTKNSKTQAFSKWFNQLSSLKTGMRKLDHNICKRPKLWNLMSQ